jgi:hypothetical protein
MGIARRPNTRQGSPREAISSVRALKAGSALVSPPRRPSRMITSVCALATVSSSFRHTGVFHIRRLKAFPAAC